MSVSFEVITC